MVHFMVYKFASIKLIFLKRPHWIKLGPLVENWHGPPLFTSASALKKEKVHLEWESSGIKGSLAQKAKVSPGLGSSHLLCEAAR